MRRRSIMVFQEFHSVDASPFGARAGAEPEAVTEVLIPPVAHLGVGLALRCNPAADLEALRAKLCTEPFDRSN